MQHPSTWDDRLLALQVESALKALGIAAGDDPASVYDLRSAVEDLRGSIPAPSTRSESTAPAMLVEDDELFGLR